MQKKILKNLQHYIVRLSPKIKKINFNLSGSYLSELIPQKVVKIKKPKKL